MGIVHIPGDSSEDGGRQCILIVQDSALKAIGHIRKEIPNLLNALWNTTAILPPPRRFM